MKTHLTQGLKNKGRDYKENALRVQHWFLHSNRFCSCSKSALLAFFLLSGWKMDVAKKVKSIHLLCLNRFCREHSTSIKNKKKVKVISNRRLDKISHLNIHFFLSWRNKLNVTHTCAVSTDLEFRVYGLESASQPFEDALQVNRPQRAISVDNSGYI